MAVVIDGKKVAADIRAEIKDVLEQTEQKPCLAVVMVGEDAASRIYVRNKIRACKEVGIKSISIHLEESVSQSELLSKIDELNVDDSVHGILVQLPLPKHIDEQTVLEAISVEKDVDGFSAENAGMLMLNRPALRSCTPAGCLRLIRSTGTNIDGMHAVVIGRSNIVGKPMAMMLLNENCTVTICHSHTGNLKDICRQADIIIASVGKPRFVTVDMVKEGAIVIDVGINRLDDGTICGDVDFDNIKDVAGFITPVPGGVGPMTIAMLLSNTLTAWQTKQRPV